MATLSDFYATAADLELSLTPIESAMPLDYVRTGMFPTNEVQRYAAALAIPCFGASTGRAGDHDYLVVPRDAKVVVREVAQRRGGVRYCIDVRANPGVMFRPGGLVGKDVLIAGEVGTPRSDEISLRIWKLFQKHFWRDFVRIGAYQVGPEALRLLHAGCRLTPDVTYPRVSDLNPALIAQTEREHRERQANGQQL